LLDLASSRLQVDIAFRMHVVHGQRADLKKPGPVSMWMSRRDGVRLQPCEISSG